jgi:hypothetical protein
MVAAELWQTHRHERDMEASFVSTQAEPTSTSLRWPTPAITGYRPSAPYTKGDARPVAAAAARGHSVSGLSRSRSRIGDWSARQTATSPPTMLALNSTGLAQAGPSRPPSRCRAAGRRRAASHDVRVAPKCPSNLQLEARLSTWKSWP